MEPIPGPGGFSSASFPFPCTALRGALGISARGGAFHPTQRPAGCSPWLSSCWGGGREPPSAPVDININIIITNININTDFTQSRPTVGACWQDGLQVLGVEQPSEEVTGKGVGKAEPPQAVGPQSTHRHCCLLGVLSPHAWIRLCFCRVFAQCTHRVSLLPGAEERGRTGTTHGRATTETVPTPSTGTGTERGSDSKRTLSRRGSTNSAKRLGRAFRAINS